MTSEIIYYQRKFLKLKKIKVKNLRKFIAIEI